MPLIQKNPFAVRGKIDRCWLFTYRTPETHARSLLPPPLLPVTHGGFGFWNIVVCQISEIRPAGVPRSLGISYQHVAYRLLARSNSGTEGLFFLRSDCDSRLVTLAGNHLTDFNFHTAPISIEDENAGRTSITVHSAAAPAEVLIDRSKRPELAWNSPFRSIPEAGEFLKYKPFGLSPAGQHATNVVAISRNESAWRATPVAVPFASWGFLDTHPADPELAFEIEPIEYRWNRGAIQS